jgi:beta-glucanase (GH16 family)
MAGGEGGGIVTIKRSNQIKINHMETIILWSERKWKISTDWGYIHPEEKPRANCWHDASATYVNKNNQLILDIHWNPKDEPDRSVPPEDYDKYPKLHADYGVGKAESVDRFGLGTYEIRACLPQGNYLWPAFWIFNPTPGQMCKPEIDIFEGYSKSTRYAKYGMICLQTGWNIQSCVHTKKELNLIPSPAMGVGINPVMTPDSFFNTYTLKWERNQLIFLINGFVVREITDQAFMDYLYNAGNGKMMVVLNTHVDGNHYKKFTLDDYVGPFIITSFTYTCG